MDAKGRISIPTGLRVELQVEKDRPPFLTNLADCPALGLYAHDYWLEIERRLETMSQIQPEVQSFRRLYISGAVEAPIDAQGRVLIPQHLRDHAGLQREVIVAGVGTRVEIWDKARFDEEIQRTRDRSQEISSVLAELGV
jgi:MraZ protein